MAGCFCWWLVVWYFGCFGLLVVVINSVVVVVYIWVMCLFGYLGLANYIDLDVVVRLLRCLWVLWFVGFAAVRLGLCGGCCLCVWFNACWLDCCFVFVACDCWLLIVLCHFYSFCYF